MQPTRRSILFASVFSRCAAAADSTIDFDTRLLTRILKWAQTDAAGDPPEWRQELPYRLAREQARWNGQPNPDAEVERNLLQVRSGALSLAGTAAFAEKILAGSEQFLSSALPHLRAYLPASTPIKGAVALAAFLPNDAFSMNYTIVVRVTDRFWANREDRLFNLQVHEPFHNGYIQHQRGASPDDAADSPALLESLLWMLQNEGLATYVAYRARTEGLTLNDYRLLESAAETARRFALLRSLMRDLRDASPSALPALRERLLQESNTQRTSYIAGAAIARRIEDTAGRATLIHTVETGPRAFLDTYRETSPPTDLAL